MISVLTKLRRHDGMRRLGKSLEKWSKSGLYRLLSVYPRSPRRASPLALDGVQRVLLVRPNFRLGNAVMGARLVESIGHERPGIEVDYLGTDTTEQLFRGMGISRYHAYSRTMSLRPWRFMSMILALRKEHYDLAIQVGEGSLTSWLLTQLSGAKKTLGQSGKLQNTYDWLLEGKTRHAYELASAIAHPLGLKCESLPWMLISEQEHERAANLIDRSSNEGVIGVFVGGHLDKRLPLEFWQTLIHRLDELGDNYLIMIGPEEEQYREELERYCGPSGQVLPLMPIREFAAVLNTEKSRKFSPRGIADRVIFRPTADEVAEILLASPLVQSPSARAEHMLDRKMSFRRF